MASSDPSIPPASGKSFFLNAPKEIRLKIYRDLLFPGSGMINLDPATPPDLDSDEDEEWRTDVDSDEDEEWRTDVDSEEDEEDEAYGTILGLDPGQKEYIKKEEDDDMESLLAQYEHFKKYPAILRVNKQIFSEASSVMYTEAKVMVQPADIFCLTPTPEDLEFGHREDPVWKYNPLSGLGNRDTKSNVRYDTPEMGGKMLPHVFARFEKIYFDVILDYEDTQHLELWMDDTTKVIREDCAEHFKRTVQKSPIMKDFVKLLSNSRRITNLDISLEVEVMANSNLMMEEMLEEDDPESGQVEEQMDDLMAIADERATELFLDSGVCDALLKLNNVKNFEFNFGFDRGKGEEYKPLPKHVESLRIMKKTIEGNFKEPQ